MFDNFLLMGNMWKQFAIICVYLLKYMKDNIYKEHRIFFYENTDEIVFVIDVGNTI